MTTISVLGFGNPIRQDESVGIYVIEQLKERISHPDLALIDMGTAAFDLLFQLKGRDRIILVDAVTNSEKPAGSFYQVPAKEIEGEIEEDPTILFQGLKWHQALSYAKMMFPDAYPQAVDVYLVAVEQTDFHPALTPAVERAGNQLVERILEDLHLSLHVHQRTLSA